VIHHGHVGKCVLLGSPVVEDVDSEQVDRPQAAGPALGLDLGVEAAAVGAALVPPPGQMGISRSVDGRISQGRLRL
jgi:hypothetical protein